MAAPAEAARWEGGGTHPALASSSEEAAAAAAAVGEDGALALGELDYTSQRLSLAGLEKELEVFADSDLLRAILDQGAAGARGRAAPPLQ